MLGKNLRLWFNIWRILECLQRVNFLMNLMLDVTCLNIGEPLKDISFKSWLFDVFLADCWRLLCMSWNCKVKTPWVRRVSTGGRTAKGTEKGRWVTAAGMHQWSAGKWHHLYEAIVLHSKSSALIYRRARGPGSSAWNLQAWAHREMQRESLIKSPNHIRFSFVRL